MSEDSKNEELNKPEQTNDNNEKVSTDNSKTKPRKKHRLLKWVGLPLIAIIVIITLVAGWFGFMPGVSRLMGATKPRDLGVRYTEADYNSYKSKTGGKYLDFAVAPANPNKPSKKQVFADPKKLETTLSSQELTAAINMVNWQWMPITNAQVKVIEGGVEISGNLNTDHIIEFANFIGGVGVSSDDVAEARTWLNRFMKNAPVYIKASGDITNGKINMNISKAQIGRFNIPLGLAGDVLTDGTKNIQNNGLSQKYYANSVVLRNGSLQFNGVAPTTIYVKH